MQQQTETALEEKNKQIPLLVAFCPVAFCPVAFCPVAFCTDTPVHSLQTEQGIAKLLTDL